MIGEVKHIFQQSLSLKTFLDRLAQDSCYMLGVPVTVAKHWKETKMLQQKTVFFLLETKPERNSLTLSLQSPCYSIFSWHRRFLHGSFFTTYVAENSLAKKFKLGWGTKRLNDSARLITIRQLRAHNDQGLGKKIIQKKNFSSKSCDTIYLNWPCKTWTSKRTAILSGSCGSELHNCWAGGIFFSGALSPSHRLKQEGCQLR